MDETQQLITDRMKVLPKEVKQVFAEAAWRQQVLDISRSHNLHFDQAELLDNEVFILLLGLQSNDELVANLVSEVGIAKDEANSILNDINNKILPPIRDSLKRLLDAEAAAETGGEVPMKAPAGNPAPVQAVAPKMPERPLSERPNNMIYPDNIPAMAPAPANLPTGNTPPPTANPAASIFESKMGGASNGDPYKEPLA